MNIKEIKELWTLLSIFQSEESDEIFNAELNPVFDRLQEAINVCPNDKNYFINCGDSNITSFANALLYQVSEKQKADETARDVIQRLAGDTSVEQVWENKKWVAMLSTDSGIVVLNVVEKKDEKTMESVEVS